MKPWQIFALLAALCNASIGGISKVLFRTGLSPNQVAFYKCLLAFVFISLLQASKLREFFSSRKQDWWKIAISALFGVFTLYFFETQAYSYANIATVVFVLLGTSTLTTFLVSRVWLGEVLGIYQFLALFLALIGLLLMIKPEAGGTWSLGGGLAAIAGMGYGLFFTTAKKMKLDTSGLGFLWWFIGFGCLFLAGPFLLNHPVLPESSSLLGLILLAIIPTLGGYYFTSKALSQGLASGVQIFELSEPIFATIIGLVFFGEHMVGKDMLGGFFILLAIYFFGKK